MQFHSFAAVIISAAVKLQLQQLQILFVQYLNE
jgi:hypothetical protein